MDAAQLFLQDHARVHSAAVAEPEGVPLEDVVLGGLSDEQVRQRPAEDLNSLAWLVWHMARCEDAAINTVVAGRRQVIEEDNWMERLGLARADIGTGMTDDEVSDFSARVDIAGLRAYRAAVGRRTREVVQALAPDAWERPISDDDLERAVAAGLIGENAGWVQGFWAGKTTAWFISWLAGGHSYWHLGEAMCVRSQAGLGLPI